jgi:hypothetical protein
VRSQIVIRELASGSEYELTDGSASDDGPAWSPDGRLIAFTRETRDGIEIGVVDLRGRMIAQIQLRIANGDVSWQPVPVGETSATPSLSAITEPEGKDIGLPFRVCFARALGGIDFVGDGTNGHAWVGVPAREDGTCPESPRPGKYLLAVDHTGDRLADSWLDLPFVCSNLCAPFDATDLDGNGSEELVVASYFSIMDFYIFAVGPDTQGSVVVAPILVGEPGHGPAGIKAGHPLRIDAGGDEGYGSSIRCEAYPSAPVIVWAWSWAPVESQQAREVHITRIQLQGDGVFHVIGTNDYTVPAGTPTGVHIETGPACGVDWYF